MSPSQMRNLSDLINDPTHSFLFRKEAIQGLSFSDQNLFEQFGQGERVPPSQSLIHLAFIEQARLQPQAIAVECQDESITYGELDRLSDRLAQHLRLHGVGPGQNVALFVQRSIPMVVGILATLKAGAAYVPQDVRIVPRTTLEHVIQKAQTRVILTLSMLRELVPVPEEGLCLEIDTFMHWARELQENHLLHVEIGCLQKSRPCFILFTSGTTGFPNGVQVTHANVCNILLTSPGDLGMRPGLKVGQILNIGFDMAAWEILGALSHGSTLVIRGKEISETVEKVDIVFATPSILAAVDVSRCQGVKTVAVAGEPCPKPLADAWGSFCDFYNSCGPTEVTIVNTMQKYDPQSGKLTIGKPTPNNTVYILDDHLNPCAIGEIGEMWAGGDCVSDGYIGNSSLTDERYRPDPFLGEGRRMFRTRDLGRWTADGELEHFGRTDDQVKIRGFRVELDSVSAALESAPACAQAVTLKLDSRNLVAFVKPENVDLKKARAMIASRLPYYCMPSLIIALDDFPRTDRGKIDKRALTTMAVKRQEREARILSAFEVSP